MSPMGKVAASPHALPAIGIPSPEADHRAIAELDPSEIELFMEEVRFSAPALLGEESVVTATWLLSLLGQMTQQQLSGFSKCWPLIVHVTSHGRKMFCRNKMRHPTVRRISRVRLTH